MEVSGHTVPAAELCPAWRSGEAFRLGTLSSESREEVGDDTVAYTGGGRVVVVSHVWHPAAVQLTAEQMEGYAISHEGGTNQELQPMAN